MPPARTVALGEAFLVSQGETVHLPSEGLSVTYVTVVSDSRCRPGQQCIVAGNATVAVAVAKAGTAPATLALNTDDEPMSARFGPYSVELVHLGSGGLRRPG